MTQLSLFDPGDERPGQAARLAPKLHALAEQGVYFGTSSWKYEGWLGSVYSPERYSDPGQVLAAEVRGRVPCRVRRDVPGRLRRFRLLPVPPPEYWKRLFEQTPASFLFALQGPRGDHRGALAGPCAVRRRGRARRTSIPRRRALRDPLREPAGALRRAGRPADLRVRHVPKSTFPTVADFLARLDPFLEALPEGFRYGVEIRNPEYLGPGYFGMLVAPNVAHCLQRLDPDAGARRPAGMPGAFTADFTVVRALLSKGRGYEEAVKQLQPYKLVREPDHAAGSHAEIAERSQRRAEAGVPLRQQPARRQRADDDRERGRLTFRRLSAAVGLGVKPGQETLPRGRILAEHVRRPGGERTFRRIDSGPGITASRLMHRAPSGRIDPPGLQRHRSGRLDPDRSLR